MYIFLAISLFIFITNQASEQFVQPWKKGFKNDSELLFIAKEYKKTEDGTQLAVRTGTGFGSL